MKDDDDDGDCDDDSNITLLLYFTWSLWVFTRPIKITVFDKVGNATTVVSNEVFLSVSIAQVRNLTSL